jgi:hypothetical protein
MRWTILTDGQPTDLANRKLLIEARAANGRVYELQYTTEKNTAIFTFFGKEQRFTGNYTITLWENKGEKGQNVVDKVNAFSLVRSTDEEDNSADAENNLEVETIDLGTTDFTLMGRGNNTVDIFSGTELMMVDGTEYFVVKKGEEMHIITAATMQSFFGNGQGGGSTTILDGSVTEAKLSDDVKNKINTASTDATNAKSAASNAQTSANNALSAASGALTAAEQAQTDAQTANSNAATASKLAADANTAANQAKETANAKQDKLTLEVLSNGNIKIGNLNGQTKEFMPATPSGDPMHYAYEELGAVWNGTGKDIVYDANVDYTLPENKEKKPFFLDWGDSYTHYNGYWLMNEVGDLTNKDMQIIFNLNPPLLPGEYMNQRFSSNARTNKVSRARFASVLSNLSEAFVNTLDMNSIRITKSGNPLVLTSTLTYSFTPSGVKKVLNEIEISRAPYTTSAFNVSKKLVYIKLTGLATNINIPCPKLHKQSLKWLIEHETGGAEKIIELHPNVYAAMVDDADIDAALEAHPLVKIAPYEL